MTYDQNTGSAAPPRDPHRVLDVLVVGGGAAGLSAALTLARSRRDVRVIDAGEPRNAPAAGVHGFLTRDGVAPRELTRLGRAEVESYGGEVHAGVATTARALPAGEASRSGDDRARSGDAGAASAGDGAGSGGAAAPSDPGAARFALTVTAPDGSVAEMRARRLVVATGLTDELPPLPGLAERWGRDVVHCPYCHGWEVRDRAIGVLATSAFATHQALLFRQLSDDVTLFLHSGQELTDDQRDELAARDIAVVTGPVSGLRIDDDRLTGVTLASGRTVPVDALAIGAPVRTNADVLGGLGIRPEAHPAGLGTTLPNDPLTGATAVPGVWAAGNAADMKMQVVTAAASGVWVGAAVNADLVAEETAAAVALRRRPPATRAKAARGAADAEEADGVHGLDQADAGTENTVTAATGRNHGPERSNGRERSI